MRRTIGVAERRLSSSSPRSPAWDRVAGSDGREEGAREGKREIEAGREESMEGAGGAENRKGRGGESESRRGVGGYMRGRRE